MDGFRQILQINLPQDDKQEVLNIIRQLERIEGVLSAEPNYYGQGGAMLFNIIDRIDVWEGRVEITYNITLNAFSGAENSDEIIFESTEAVPEAIDLAGYICYNDKCIGVEPYTTPETEPQKLPIRIKCEAYFEFWNGMSWQTRTAGSRIQ